MAPVLAANDRFESLIGDLLARQFPKRVDTALPARILIQSVNGVLEKAATREGAETSIGLLLGVLCNGLK